MDLELKEARSFANPGVVNSENANFVQKESIHTLGYLPRTICVENSTGRAAVIRRAIDIFASSALLIILAPLLLTIALLIIMDDPAPPVFAHRRVGKDGETFPCLKFRSMYVDAQTRLHDILVNNIEQRAEWERNHKLARDPRVTRIGRYLRLFSLDELPQLLNVFGGSMTFVGPRPIVTDEITRYGRFVSHYFSVKPGLTGLWQISGRSSVSYRRRVAADVLYVRIRSLNLDLRIILMTIPVVFLGWGAW